MYATRHAAQPGDDVRNVLAELLREVEWEPAIAATSGTLLPTAINGSSSNHLLGIGSSSSDHAVKVEEQAAFTVGQHAAEKEPRRRKRGPTNQQKVKELEVQVAEQLAKLQQLSLDNEFMSERVRMLELVIKVRDLQLDRLQDIQAGLKYNPFASIGSNVEEIRTAAPAWVAKKFIDISGSFATRLAPLLPVLDQHPSLLLGPAPGELWSNVLQQTEQQKQQQGQGGQQGQRYIAGACAGKWDAPAEDPSDALVAHYAQHKDVDPQLLRDLYRVAVDSRELQQTFMHAFLVCPQLMLASSLSVHAMDPEQHTSWQALAALIKDVPSTSTTLQPPATTPTAALPAPAALAAPGRSAGAGSSHALVARGAEDEGGAGVSAVAPEAHWRQVIHQVRLSDQQKLQAAVLRSIVARPLSDIRRQRAQLGTAFAQVHANIGLPPGSINTPHNNSSSSLTAPAHAASAPALLASHDSGPPAAAARAGGSGTQHLPLLQQHSSGELQRQSTGGSAGAGEGGVRQGSGCRIPKTSWQTAEMMQQETVLLKRLQHSVYKEMCLVMLITEVLFRHVLTPVQLGLLVVNCWPYLPDDLALLNAAADDYVYTPKSSDAAS